MTTASESYEFADPHIYHYPQFIFFLNTPPTNTNACNICDTWEIAKYNSNQMSKDVEIIHIGDSKAIAKYNFNKPPQPYKTYVKLLEEDDMEDPDLQYYYVEEQDYHIEKFEHERNQLVRILGRLNAKSVYFRESINTTCDITCMTTATKSQAQGEVQQSKMDEMMQRNLFDDKEWTETQIKNEFGDMDKYSRKMRELINKRFSGVTFDNYSSSFNDYNNVTSRLTDVLNVYLGIQCGREYSRKITYEYTIKYFSYKKGNSHISHTGKPSNCLTFCSGGGGGNKQPVDATNSSEDPFDDVSKRRFLSPVTPKR